MFDRDGFSKPLAAMGRYGLGRGSGFGCTKISKMSMAPQQVMRYHEMVCCLLVAWLDTSTLGSNSCISPNFTIFHLAWPCVRRSLAPVSRQWMATRWQIATKRWELRLSRMPSRTELHRSAVTDRPKWESELLVWPVQNDVFWCIFIY